MPEDNTTVVQRADLLLSKLAKGKELYQVVSDQLTDTMIISGHSLSHWGKELKMYIPVDNLNTQLCKELDLEIMKRTEIASLFFAIANAKSQYIRRGTDSNYNAAIMEIIDRHQTENRRIPAANTLQSLAQINTDDMETAAVLADIETKFWKNVLDHLSTCRKIIENVSLNISVELKAEQAAQHIDNLNAKLNARRNSSYE